MQFEFPRVLGPGDGRLVLRAEPGGRPEQIIVLRLLGAPQRRLLARRRSSGRSLEAGATAPAAVATSRATVIDTRADAATRPDPWQAATAALASLNRVIHAFRIATADPYVQPLKLADAIAVRVGWGEGEQVAEGRWTEAQELALETLSRRTRRPTAALRPEERLAALLGARDEALDCEELALVARLELDQGRPRNCRLIVRLAIARALAELPQRADLSERLAELEQLRDPQDSGQTSHALGRLEAILRARTARGMTHT